MIALRTALVLIATALSLAPALAQSPEPRREQSLDVGWRFIQRDVGEAAAAPDYDDAAWTAVSVPHTSNWIGSYNKVRDPRTNLYQGVSWYRLRFAVPAATKGERRFVQFDGVGNIADVWLNGRRLGRHAGAFSRFRFDVSDAIRPDGDNVLVVRADNSARAPGSSTANVIPLAGDFFLFGGIYRHVALLTTGAQHLDLLDDGGPGVYATTTAVDQGTATVDVRARIAGTGRADVDILLALDDADGRTVASRTVRARLREGAGLATAALSVPDPHVWNGRADPYLYTLRAEVWRRGTLTDRLVQPYGIRTFRIDADRGFFLNGKPLPLHGISRHQDRFGVGWAVSDEDQRRDMALIAELGANTVRGAHYQHAPIWYDLADRNGMVMWAEIPFVNRAGWTRGAGLDPDLRANAEQQLRELIKQNASHPSIVTWSIGNEVDIVDLGPTTRANSRALLDALQMVAKREDPSRPTSFADCCEPNYAATDTRGITLAGSADTIGYNRYSGWYYDRADELGPNLDRLRRRHPGLPISVSEYGAGGATTQHTDDPRGGAIDSHGRIQPEEYQSWVLEQNWAAIRDRPWLWSSWLWVMFDFASPRAEGDATDLNTKGVMTSDRSIRKDAFYFFQAQWAAQPVLHITQRRYVDRFYPVTDVRLYSNAGDARLTLNGRDLGSRPCRDGICVWPRVTLDTGANRLVATAQFGDREVTDTVEWTAHDPHAGLALDAGNLLGQVAPDGTRFGSDAFFTGGEPTTIAAMAGGDAGLPAAMARTVRRGDFAYDLPLPDGRWRLSLWFAEPDTAATARGFSVLAQGSPVVTDLDVARAAGGAQRAIRRDVPVTVTDGHLRLQFRSGHGPALLSALRLVPLGRPSR